MVKLLLLARASYTSHDAFGRTPVDEALYHNDPGVLKELFQAGANVLDVDGTASNDLKVLRSMAETEHWLIPSQEAERISL